MNGLKTAGFLHGSVPAQGRASPECWVQSLGPAPLHALKEGRHKTPGALSHPAAMGLGALGLMAGGLPADASCSPPSRPEPCLPQPGHQSGRTERTSLIFREAPRAFTHAPNCQNHLSACPLLLWFCKPLLVVWGFSSCRKQSPPPLASGTTGCATPAGDGPGPRACGARCQASVWSWLSGEDKRRQERDENAH